MVSKAWKSVLSPRSLNLITCSCISCKNTADSIFDQVYVLEALKCNQQQYGRSGKVAWRAKQGLIRLIVCAVGLEGKGRKKEHKAENFGQQLGPQLGLVRMRKTHSDICIERKESDRRRCHSIYMLRQLALSFSYVVVQCNLDLVTLLVSAKTVTKSHNVTKSNDFMQ